MLPRDESFSISRLIINEVNDLLKSKCLVKSFHFINQNNGWTLNNGALDFSLFYSDGLHLVEKGNLKLGKSILKAIDSNSNANPYKNAVCFNLNECDFPPLPSPATTSKHLYSPVKYVGPVRKPIRRLFKSFAQGHEPFRSTVLPVCSVPISVPVSVLLELQLQPFPLTYQTFAILLLRFDLFLQSLKLPLLLTLLFLLIKNMHLLPLLSLLIYQILHVLVLPLLQHFLFHHIRTVTELLQFLVPIYPPILRLVLLIL